MHVPENIQTPTMEGILLRNPHTLNFQLMQRQLQLFKKLANSVTKALSITSSNGGVTIKMQ